MQRLSACHMQMRVDAGTQQVGLNAWAKCLPYVQLLGLGVMAVAKGLLQQVLLGLGSLLAAGENPVCTGVLGNVLSKRIQRCAQQSSVTDPP